MTAREGSSTKNVLVIPDVHLKPWMFEQASRVMESGIAGQAVCLMDIPDDWGREHYIELYVQTFKAAIEFAQKYPHPGWVEQDAMEIYASQYAVMEEAVLRCGITASEIAAIGITNQRETTIVWDKDTGHPIAPAIVWQCRRTAEACETLKKQGLAESIRQKTGLVIDAYFSATKIAWILAHVPGARAKA